MEQPRGMEQPQMEDTTKLKPQRDDAAKRNSLRGRMQLKVTVPEEGCNYLEQPQREDATNRIVPEEGFN